MPARKISAGLSVSGAPGQIGCGEPRDGCGTVQGCNASYDPRGSMSGSGRGEIDTGFRAGSLGTP